MNWKLKVRQPAYVMLSSDYSAQEPRILSFVSKDPKMIQAFKDGKDIYATIASVAFNVPYENCLEFHPVTGEYQKAGKKRRGEAKTIVLGITYGRSVPSIAEQLYGTNKEMSEEEKIKDAQRVYDSVLNAFPNLRTVMLATQNKAKQLGYTETILGRRRHLPDMMLNEFEFEPLPGYVNPDVDPLDPSSMQDSDAIPQRIVDALKKEFANYKYFGQIVKKTKELKEKNIRVINNRPKINDATRQCLNCVDFETEILTKSGWKRYDQVSEGDEILSYSLKSHEITDDVVQAVHVYNEPTEVVRFESPTFSAASTMEHRWVVGEYDEIPRIKQTKNIFNNNWPDYPIIRVANNSFEDDRQFTDDQLKIIGWIMTDGSIEKKQYSIHIYQSVRRNKNKEVYEDIMHTLVSAGVHFTDSCRRDYYHEIYLKKNDFTDWVHKNLSDRVMTFDFISRLSQRQAEIVMRAMLQGNGSGVDGKGYGKRNERITLCCKDAAGRDAFQYLCFRAGYATNASVIDNSEVDYPSNHKLYASMDNIPVSNGTYYDICVLRIRRAQIYPHHKSLDSVSGVWCITSREGTWIARRDGKVYITGNSVIQGSAADQSKMAMLEVDNNKRWKEIGGRILILVHDELIAEVPIKYCKEGGELLSKCMCDAASFLPFDSKCDVETVLHWYGSDYFSIVNEKKPSTIHPTDPSEIKWLQYHITEMEYLLPAISHEDGSDLLGDENKGINGIWTDELEASIEDYMKKYNLSESEFLDHIERKVELGV